jgi:hypothetical protein
VLQTSTVALSNFLFIIGIVMATVRKPKFKKYYNGSQQFITSLYDVLVQANVPCEQQVLIELAKTILLIKDYKNEDV